MLKYIILIAFVITGLSSCKKVKNDQIQAGIYVKQYKTNSPIANAMILITRGVPPSGFGTTVIDTLYTDANGRATYNKNVDTGYKYYAEAYKEGYFDTHNSQVDVRPGEKNLTTTIYMYAHSWVKLHVKNVNPFDQTDIIDFNSGCYTYHFIGIIDTTFLWCDNCNCAWFASYDYQAGAFIKKNNINTTQMFAFTPISHDTITIEINY